MVQTLVRNGFQRVENCLMLHLMYVALKEL